jgi:isochorismate pyruvate lyase
MITWGFQIYSYIIVSIWVSLYQRLLFLQKIYNVMLDPKQCKNIQEIREGIDEIDLQIIELFGKRLNFVEEIVKFKNDEEAIVAKDRQKEVIELRRKWADSFNLDPDLIESIYKTLLQFNIKKELKIFRNQDK